MTKFYYDNSPDFDPAQAVIGTIEKDTGEKVFTLRFLDRDPEENFLEAIIVFENKSMLHARIAVQSIEGQLALRIAGNYM